LGVECGEGGEEEGGLAEEAIQTAHCCILRVRVKGISPGYFAWGEGSGCVRC
jgi:hypothetical protein